VIRGQSRLIAPKKMNPSGPQNFTPSAPRFAAHRPEHPSRPRQFDLRFLLSTFYFLLFSSNPIAPNRAQSNPIEPKNMTTPPSGFQLFRISAPQHFPGPRDKGAGCLGLI
jgi:hypothetical protein